MSTLSYLVRKDNKTMFELGKDSWFSIIALFRTRTTIEESLVSEWPDAPMGFKFHIDTREYLINEIKKAFDEGYYLESVRNIEFVSNLADKIIIFAEDQTVYMTWDTDDTFAELRRSGFRTIESMYKSFDP